MRAKRIVTRGANEPTGESPAPSGTRFAMPSPGDGSEETVYPGGGGHT